MDIPFSKDGESAVERQDRLIKRCKPCFILITRSSYIDGMVEEGMDDESTLETSNSEADMAICEPLISNDQIVSEVGSQQLVLQQPISQPQMSPHEIVSEIESMKNPTSPHQEEVQTSEHENSQQLVPQQPISQPQFQPHEIVSEVGSMKNPYAISKTATICEKNLLEQPFNIHKSVRNQEVGLVKNPFASYRHPSVSIDELTLLYFQAISGVLFTNNEKEDDDVDIYINGLIEQSTFSENEFLSLLDSLDLGLPNACKNV